MLAAVLSSFELDAWSFVVVVGIPVSCSVVWSFCRESCNRAAVAGNPHMCAPGLVLAS